MADFVSFDRQCPNLKLAHYNRRRAAEERIKAQDAKDLGCRALYLVLAEIFDEREAAASLRSALDWANLDFIEI